MRPNMKLLSGLILALVTLVASDQFDEDNYGVKYADDCEVCKIVVTELTSALTKTGKRHEVIETGYSVEKAKKKTKYVKSELRLVEVLEELCDTLLEYNVHKERKDWTRFARGTSETFQALDGLVAKGVKVDIGIPKELWHKPSAEVTELKTQCERLLESYEENIEEWYFNQQNQDLENYLCRNLALKNKDQSCLNFKGEIADDKSKKKKKKKERTTEL